MKRCLAAIIVSIVVLSISVAHAEDQDVAVKRLLERLAGRWTWTGQQANIGAENSPYGQAGQFVGSGVGRLIMNGQFILDEYQEKSPEGNILKGVSLISYDPVKKCFVSRDCMSDGSTSIAEFTIEGRARKDNITITSKTGETLLARVTGEYSRDWKRLEVTWEGSTDNGKTWKRWCTAVFEKVDTDLERNKPVMQRVFDDVFNGKNIDAIDEIYHEDFIRHDPGGSVSTGIDQHKKMVANLFKTIPNYHEELHEMIIDGDLAACYWTSSGTNSKTGEKFSGPCMSIYRFNDGKIIEQWLHWEGKDQ